MGFRPRPDRVAEPFRLTSAVGLPCDAMLGEPVALRCGGTASVARMRPDLGYLETARAADMGGPFVATFEHDLLELRRPAHQQPPAALGARPLVDAVFQRPCPRHLVWRGQPISDLKRGPLVQFRTSTPMRPAKHASGRALRPGGARGVGADRKSRRRVYQRSDTDVPITSHQWSTQTPVACVDNRRAATQ